MVLSRISDYAPFLPADQSELPELEAKIAAVGDETYAASMMLCMAAAGHIAVDVLWHRIR